MANATLPSATVLWQHSRMKTLQIELPDQLAGEVEKAVQGGWFKSADELVLQALRDFVSSRRFALTEQQQLDDVAWALREKSGGK